MDAMYLNLMFINHRPPVGAGVKGARSTRPSLTPPPPAKNPGSAPGTPQYNFLHEPKQQKAYSVEVHLLGLIQHYRHLRSFWCFLMAD